MTTLTESDKEKLVKLSELKWFKDADGIWVYYCESGLATRWLNPDSTDFYYQVHAILLPKVREQDDRFIYEFTNKITMRAMRKVLDEKRFGVANYLLESISAPPLTIATAILELIKEEG